MVHYNLKAGMPACREQGKSRSRVTDRYVDITCHTCLRLFDRIGSINAATGKYFTFED